VESILDDTMVAVICVRCGQQHQGHSMVSQSYEPHLQWLWVEIAPNEQLRASVEELTGDARPRAIFNDLQTTMHRRLRWVCLTASLRRRDD
jgi:hypothetical protein